VLDLSTIDLEGITIGPSIITGIRLVVWSR
jgi:hypothetical protein